MMDFNPKKERIIAGTPVNLPGMTLLTVYNLASHNLMTSREFAVMVEPLGWDETYKRLLWDSLTDREQYLLLLAMSVTQNLDTIIIVSPENHLGLVDKKIIDKLIKIAQKHNIHVRIATEPQVWRRWDDTITIWTPTQWQERGGKLETKTDFVAWRGPREATLPEAIPMDGPTTGIEVIRRSDGTGVEVIASPKAQGTVTVPACTGGDMGQASNNVFHLGSESVVTLVSGCESSGFCGASARDNHNQLILEKDASAKLVETSWATPAESEQERRVSYEIELKEKAKLEIMMTQLEIPARLRTHWQVKMGKDATLQITQKILTAGKQNGKQRWEIAGDKTAQVQLRQKLVVSEESVQKYQMNIDKIDLDTVRWRQQAIVTDEAQLITLPNKPKIVSAQVTDLKPTSVQFLQAFGLGAKEARARLLDAYLHS